MVGNDVVDLVDPETRAEGLNPRFDNRVFTADERGRLATSSDAHSLRWTIWAAKESAYKLAKRFNPKTIFAHSRVITDLDEDGRGTVHHDSWLCAVVVNREETAIHAIAMTDHRDWERIIVGLDSLSDGGDASEKVRELASASIAHHLNIDAASITITNGSDRIPALRVDEMPVGHLSLSHHGAYVAFAWMPPL